jgi:hypothetical protein
MNNKRVTAKKITPQKTVATAGKSKPVKKSVAGKSKAVGRVINVGGVDVVLLRPKVRSKLPLAKVRQAVKAAKASRPAGK